MRQFSGTTYVSDDEKMGIIVRDERQRIGCCYKAELANTFFLIDLSASVARQRPTASYKMNTSWRDHSSDETWQFHGGWSASRRTNSRLSITVDGQAHTLRKINHDAAESLASVLTHQPVSRHQEPMFLLDMPNGLSLYIDRSKYDRSSHNARAFVISDGAFKSVRMKEFEYKNHAAAARAQFGMNQLSIPEQGSDKEPTYVVYSATSTWREPEVMALTYRDVSEVESLGIDPVEADSLPELPTL